MSKVDFGRINAENEDFFSRKTQKNEGAKKGDEFLFDDEFDNKHVSNNERAGGDRFDHEHHVDHEHHFNPKEDMTTKNNVDDNTITLISDSDEDTTTEETTASSLLSGLYLSEAELTELTAEASEASCLMITIDDSWINNMIEISADDIKEIREYLLTLGDGESYTVTTTNEAGDEITTTYTLDGDNVVVTSSCNDHYAATYDSDGNLIEFTCGDDYGTFNYSISRNDDGSVDEITLSFSEGWTVTVSGDGSKVTIDGYNKSNSGSTTSDLYANFANRIGYMLDYGFIDEDTYNNACEALANLVGYKGD